MRLRRLLPYQAHSDSQPPLAQASRTPPAQHRLRRAIVHNEQAYRDLIASSPSTNPTLIAEAYSALAASCSAAPAPAHLQHCATTQSPQHPVTITQHSPRALHIILAHDRLRRAAQPSEVIR